MSAVQKVIRQMREARGLSQKALADLAGVTRQTISNIERGAFPPKRESLEAISAAFGVPVWEIEKLAHSSSLAPSNGHGS